MMWILLCESDGMIAVSHGNDAIKRHHIVPQALFTCPKIRF
jgi:hypothetical protein